MEKLLQKLNEIDIKVCSLRKVCKENDVDVIILNGFNLQKIKNIYIRLIKHYKQHESKGNSLWFQSQLKLFHWILIVYSYLIEKKILEFTEQDWNYIKLIFYAKDISTFKFQSKRLLAQSSKNSRIWNSEEDQILTSIMENEQYNNKWNEVARKFYEISKQKYFRTGKQCRQHWLNHLDPTKMHGNWTIQEDYSIFRYAVSNGKKWSAICKSILPHRTEHMIKNRYKSLVYKFRKNSIEQFDNEKILVERILQRYEEKQIQREKYNNPILEAQKSVPLQTKQKSQTYQLKELNKGLKEPKEERNEREKSIEIIYAQNFQNQQQVPPYCVGSIPMIFYYQSLFPLVAMQNPWDYWNGMHDSI